MKAAFFLLVIFFVLASAYIEIEHDDGSDILKELKKRNNGVIIVLFVVDSAVGSNLAEKNYDFEYHLIKKVLDNYPSFKYAKVNVNDPAYEELVNASGINATDLLVSPSVMIAEDKKGEWIHGDESLIMVSKAARIYNERVDD